MYSTNFVIERDKLLLAKWRLFRIVGPNLPREIEGNIYVEPGSEADCEMRST
jgi:hypothetical protein